MRVNESGSGLVPMNNLGIARGTLPVMNENSKYANNFVGMKCKAGPPPYRAMMGNIDVIGGPGAGQRQLVTPMKVDLTPKMNTIQVCKIAFKTVANIQMFTNTLILIIRIVEVLIIIIY